MLLGPRLVSSPASWREHIQAALPPPVARPVVLRQCPQRCDRRRRAHRLGGQSRVALEGSGLDRPHASRRGARGRSPRASLAREPGFAALPPSSRPEPWGAHVASPGPACTAGTTDLVGTGATGTRRRSAWETRCTHIHSVVSDCNESQMNYNKIWSFKGANSSMHHVAGGTLSSVSLRAIVRVNNYPRQTYRAVLTLM